jgi:hypothetical protein
MNTPIHEPDATLMSADDVWEDAQTVADVLRKHLLKTEPAIKFSIPFSIFLATLDTFNREGLLLLRRHVEEKLAA